jgi:hypothetical protein
MKQWIVILLLFAVSTSIAACVELKAGNANIDLGDGYKASFVLPDIEKPYVVEDAYTAGTSGNTLFKPYGFSISSEGVYLASMKMYVYSSPQFQYVREAGLEKSPMPDIEGPQVITPKTISGSPGYVGYILPIGATGTDTGKVMAGFFKCFPGAQEVSGDLKGIIEVSGETSGLQASAQSLLVFNSLLDSIKISGPGI